MWVRLRHSCNKYLHDNAYLFVFGLLAALSPSSYESQTFESEVSMPEYDPSVTTLSRPQYVAFVALDMLSMSEYTAAKLSSERVSRFDNEASVRFYKTILFY